LRFAALQQRFSDGSLSPRVDREFPLEEVAEAVRYMTERAAPARSY
jgi:hypothetical protein